MRLAAQAKGGYYPCAPEVVALAANYLRPPEDGRFTVLDPCCGKGAAVKQLSESLGCRPEDTYAIELDEGRAAHARETLPDSRVLAPASFFGCSITPKSISLAWVNPPFDDELGGGGRVEAEFLRRATNVLRPRGVIALVCPERVALSWELKQFILQWYDQIGLLPFPEEHRRFGEVVLFGVRRDKPVSPWSLNWEDECGPPGTYSIPSGPRPRHFEKTEMTESELARALESSRLRRLLEPPDEPPLPQPPLALGTGHIALLLAAGHLDGIVEPDDEPPHVVRGTARKVSFVSAVEEHDNADGSTTTKTTLQEKIVLTVRAVGMDGTIKTFSQE